ncbi:hypothetical protein FSP39_004139, partial [Pinctada imbricata]
FVIDGSESISDANYKIVINFVTENIKPFEIASDKIQLAALSFSRNVTHKIPIVQNQTEQNFESLLSKFERQRMTTNTDVALREMRQILDNSTMTSRVGILLTDGESYDFAKTLSEASMARASGIEMVAIGINVMSGSAADKELNFITGNTDNVILLSSYQHLGNITQVKAIKDLLCREVTTTTTTSTTTTSTTTPRPTAPPSTAKILTGPCEGCKISNGFGYNPFTGDCTQYVLCFPNGTVEAYKVKSCGFGQFWSQEKVTCVLPASSDCPSDPCSGQVDGATLPMSGHCRGYWTCLGGSSVGLCCNIGQEFVSGSGCVADTDSSCNDICESNQTSSGPCNLSADPDPNYFLVTVPGSGSVRRKCAPGSQFDALSCGCSIIVALPSTTGSPVCSPMVYHGNDGKVYDLYNEIPVGISNVVINTNTATFFGNGEMLIWRLANYDFHNTLVIRFSITVSASSTSTLEQVLTNCYHTDGAVMPPSIDIRVVRNAANSQIIHTLITADNAYSLTSNIQNGATVEVIYAYDGRTFAAYAGGTEVSTPASGDIKMRQSSMVLGRPSVLGQGVGYLNGIVTGVCFQTDK